jgi:hypothetical protein
LWIPVEVREKRKREGAKVGKRYKRSGGKQDKEGNVGM